MVCPLPAKPRLRWPREFPPIVDRNVDDMIDARCGDWSRLEAIGVLPLTVLETRPLREGDWARLGEFMAREVSALSSTPT